MIELKTLPKESRYLLVRGCESFFITYKSPLWQKSIVNLLKEEFGREYEIPIKVLLTSATKAKRYNLTGSQFPLDKNKFSAANKITNQAISYKKMKDLLYLMEEKDYITILKGYYNHSKDCMSTYIRFHDKLLNNLNKKFCAKWGMSRLDGFKQVEVVDSENSTKTKKVFHSLKKFKGVRIINEEITIVNKEIEKHVITYRGVVCSVIYKRRFEGDLLSAGRWYVIGTFQTEGSEGRYTIRIDGCHTTEQDVSRIHPSLLATLAGFILPDEYDPYDITSYIKTDIPAKELRNFIKPCFMALLYSTSRNTALHEIRNKLFEDHKIASWLDAETILSSLEEHNYMFKEFFYKKENWKLCQYLDSAICTKVMVHFAKLGKIALGYHDSWITKSEDKAELLNIIAVAWNEVMGNTNNLKIDEEFDSSL